MVKFFWQKYNKGFKQFFDKENGLIFLFIFFNLLMMFLSKAELFAFVESVDLKEFYFKSLAIIHSIDTTQELMSSHFADTPILLSFIYLFFAKTFSFLSFYDQRSIMVNSFVVLFFITYFKYLRLFPVKKIWIIFSMFLISMHPHFVEYNYYTKQSDIIILTFLLITLIFIKKEKKIVASIVYGLTLCLKPQSLIFLPIMFLYLGRGLFSFKHIFIVLITIILVYLFFYILGADIPFWINNYKSMLLRDLSYYNLSYINGFANILAPFYYSTKLSEIFYYIFSFDFHDKLSRQELYTYISIISKLTIVAFIALNYIMGRLLRKYLINVHSIGCVSLMLFANFIVMPYILVILGGRINIYPVIIAGMFFVWQRKYWYVLLAVFYIAFIMNLNIYFLIKDKEDISLFSDKLVYLNWLSYHLVNFYLFYFVFKKYREFLNKEKVKYFKLIKT